MAHGDYDCCAICDSKQSYNSDAKAKGEICGACVADLVRKTGVLVGTPEEFLVWIQKTDAAEVEKALVAVDFSKCFYPNPVDEAIEVKCPGIFERHFRSRR